MSNANQPDVTRLLRDLTAELRRLQREVESDSVPPGPSPGDLSRFTSEVAIPGIILLLETNIRVLRLLRRTIRMADGRDPRAERGRSEVRARAEALGQTTLQKLDEALAELQSSVEESENGELEEILQEARELQSDIQERLDSARDGDLEASDPGDEPIGIDVDAELRAIKHDLDDEDNRQGSDDDTDGE